ncbi:MAG: BLUF domain-containing protein [Pseudomonadota bacterium]
MSLTQLVYVSQPFGFDDTMLSGILLDARRNNLRDDVTGALIARGDLYVQMLEGPRRAVSDCYARIREDDRHVSPRKLMDRTIKTRLFPGWSMKDDAAQSWVWSREEVRGGALEEATEQEVLGFFMRLAAQDTLPFRPH